MIAAVILNRNGAACLDRAVAAVDGQTRPSDLRILVDNASTDGSADDWETRFPEWRGVRLSENTGCAGGYNAGAQAALEAGAEIVVLLNNDVFLEPECLERLAAHMNADERVGVCGPVVLWDADGTLASAGGVVDGRESAARVRRDAAPDGPEETEFVEGAVFCVRAEVFERLGGFDEAYFAYLEDVDFCMRARQSGVRVVVVPDARARHLGSNATGGGYTPRRCYLLGRGAALFARKHFDLAGTARFVAWACLAVVGATVRELFRGNARAALAKGLGCFDGLFGRPPRPEDESTESGEA